MPHNPVSVYGVKNDLTAQASKSSSRKTNIEKLVLKTERRDQKYIKFGEESFKNLLKTGMVRWSLLAILPFVVLAIITAQARFTIFFETNIFNIFFIKLEIA